MRFEGRTKEHRHFRRTSMRPGKATVRPRTERCTCSPATASVGLAFPLVFSQLSTAAGQLVREQRRALTIVSDDALYGPQTLLPASDTVASLQASSTGGPSLWMAAALPPRSKAFAARSWAKPGEQRTRCEIGMKDCHVSSERGKRTLPRSGNSTGTLPQLLLQGSAAVSVVCDRAINLTEIKQIVTSAVRAIYPPCVQCGGTLHRGVLHPGVPVMWQNHIRDLFPSAKAVQGPCGQGNQSPCPIVSAGFCQ